MPELNMLENFNPDHAFWDILVNYLSVKDIQALKVTCRLFNGQLDKMDVAWQPYLNELHSIDQTIRVTPEQSKTIRETFIVGLEKVRTRQLAEIAYLQERHGENCFAVFSPHIKAALESKEPLRLHDVVAISKELDAFNRGLIEPDIIRARNVGIWLSLQGKGISRIPQALFDYSLYAAFWSKLQIFDFSDNFVQSLPRNFGERLQSLQTLNCDNNQLVELPESVGKLTSLQGLQLDQNRLAELPQSFGNLSALQRLVLSDNQLKLLPESFGSLTALQVLELERNKLAELPQTFGNLIALQRLQLTDNNLRLLPESIGNLTALQWLRLDDNKLMVLPDSIGNLTSLRQLSLENNQLTVLPTTLDRSVVGGMHNQNPQPGSASDEVTKKRVMDDGNNAKRQKLASAEDEPVIESAEHHPDPAPLIYQFDVENATAADELTKKRVNKDDNSSSAKRQKTSESEDDDMDFEPALRSSMKRRENP